MINTDEIRVWGIHSLNDHLFLKESIIAIGWKEFGDCVKVESSREAFKNHFAASFPSINLSYLFFNFETFTI